MKRKLIIVASTLSIIVLSLALAGFFSGMKEDFEAKAPPIVKKTVETRKVIYENLKTEVITYGRVQSAQSLDLLSEVSGRMYEGSIRLKEGQRFKKGTLLFLIDEEEASLNLKSQKSDFLRDLAGILPDIMVDFEENSEAWKQYFNSLDIDQKFEDLPKAVSNKEKTFLATKGIFSSFYTIKSAEVRLAKHRYYAPFNGSVAEVSMQSGSFVNPGTTIGKIIRSGAYELKVAVETRDIPWVQQRIPVKIYSDETQQYWKGVVIRIGDYVNQNTQSVDVFIAIEPNGKRIYDGQFFQAIIPAQTITNGMIIPRNAIYNGNEVFVVEDDSLLRVQTVNVIRFTGENAIFNGLDSDTDLVVEPLIGAYNNMKVQKREKKDINMEIKDDEGKKLLNTKATQTRDSNK